MRKVAFYINNATLSSVDCKGITVANPGIGGSEYQFILISYLLMQRHNGLDVKVYTTAEGIFPDGFCYEIVSELTAAVTAAERWGAEYLVFKHEVGHILERTLEQIRSSVKLISWCHIFVSELECDYYTRCSSIYKVINVGREMNDLYRDHPIYEKSTYIYNAVNTEGCRPIVIHLPKENQSLPMWAVSFLSKDFIGWPKRGTILSKRYRMPNCISLAAANSMDEIKNWENLELRKHRTKKY